MIETWRGLVVVMTGSALGGGARWLIQRASTNALTTPLPLGTIAINIVGSFLLTFVAQWPGLAATTRLFLTTGLLGGFTTYSSFNHETVTLVQDGHGGLAVLNVVVTVGCCLLGGALAVVAGRTAFH